MTAAPVMSITDELIAELDALANANHAYVPVPPNTMRALLAERADLKRCAELRQWVPVGERAPVYPDKGKCYVMGVQRGHPYPFPVRYTPSKWEYMDGDTCRGLTHWMPMPDLPMAAQ